jgi:hypothetical protein
MAATAPILDQSLVEMLVVFDNFGNQAGVDARSGHGYLSREKVSELITFSHS